MSATEDIDRLLHDAEHAKSGAEMAMRMRDHKSAFVLEFKWNSYRQQAVNLFLTNPESRWPDPEDCEWPAPIRK